jgi:hypothetical protein
VLAIWTTGDVTFDTMAALIDFDNAVVKSNLVGNSNKNKMQSDYRALNRIIINAIQDWEHVQIFRTLWESYKDVPNLNFAYKKFITFLNLSKHNTLTKEFILDYLKTLVLIDTHREDIKPIIVAIKSICTFHGKDEQYNAAILQFDRDYQDYVDLDLMDTNMNILENTTEKLKVYNQIFNS